MINKYSFIIFGSSIEHEDPNEPILISNNYYSSFDKTLSVAKKELNDIISDSRVNMWIDVLCQLMQRNILSMPR